MCVHTHMRVVLGTEHGTLHMLGKYSPTELHPWPFNTHFSLMRAISLHDSQRRKEGQRISMSWASICLCEEQSVSLYNLHV